jgi:hypothetical protein
MMDPSRAGADTPGPSFSMLDLYVSDEAVEYAFLLNGTRFFVSVVAENLRGKGDLLKEFNAFKDDLDDPDTQFQFEEWVLAALQNFVQELAPTPEPGTRKPVTLLQFFSPPTFAFQLINENGKLRGIQEPYNYENHGDLSPRTRIVDNSTHVPAPSATSNNRVLLRSELPSVPLIPASELERVDDGLHDYEMSDVPKKVRRRGSDEVFFFKAGFKDHGHLREIELLSRISDTGKFYPPFRTSKIVGLVVWDNDCAAEETSLMGFLLEYVNGDSLQVLMDSASMATRMKWIGQIEATVERLHEFGIVWGDVKPDNVMIDDKEDAIVVDFGGGYTPDYIPRELQQTAQGDLIGLEHMRAALAIRRKS